MKKRPTPELSNGTCLGTLAGSRWVLINSISSKVGRLNALEIKFYFKTEVVLE